MNTRCNPARGGSGELNMQPFINFMVILGTALIAFVEFSHVSVITIKTFNNKGVTTKNKVTDAIPVNTDLLKLTAIITDSSITFGAGSGFLPTIHYNTVPKKGGEVDLVLLDSEGKQSVALYKNDGRIIYSDKGELLTIVSAGDIVYTAGVENPEIVRDPSEYKLGPVDIAIEVERQLGAVHVQFNHLPDANAIVLAADQSVVYDRIVKLIDASANAGFTDVSFSRLRTGNTL